MTRHPAPIKLTENERIKIRNLERKLAEEGKHRWADRCRVILLIAGEYGIQEVSSIVDRPYSTVQQWSRLFRQEGFHSLKPKTSSRGRKKKLGDHERILLSKAIERGPIAAGYHGNVWTSKMVANYIQKRWGVKYHPGHVRKLLHELGFSVQFPREKLALADQDAQERWLKETYPNIKKKPDRMVQP